MAVCNAATAHLYCIASLASECEILCSSLQFIATSFETQDYKGFKPPLHQSINERHQGLQRCQGKIKHIFAGSVKLYQTLGFPHVLGFSSQKTPLWLSFTLKEFPI